ncbi:tetratricopeptide repeat protein [Methanoregula sp.]|uniref:tetratricopeptide repeat protein n=1 Tax=Methanoregula sp. TaxID=2052170 RepID=UPI002C16CCC5|nr:tetratricopeptide repeat protein [Methanoregula sp.]HVP97052.1 tetratricopeptide repeat protein [Methanoregula sp.]
MQTKWILLLALAVIAGIVVIVPLVLPGLTPAGIVQQGQATAGDAFMLVNQSGMALSLYNGALAANPGDPVLLQKKAEALIASGQTGEAEQIYRQLLAANPHDPVVLVRMGDFSYMDGDYPGAIAYYDAALAIQPKSAPTLLRDGDANLMLAATQYQQQHAVFLDNLDAYRTALNEYAQAEKLDPRLSPVVSARTLVADNYEAGGNYQDLVAALRRSS